MQTERLAALFTAKAGGEFVASPRELQRRLQSIRAFIFDWDGVFNNGAKTGAGGSGFDEADAMGSNLLRFGFWLRNGELPFTAIVTGEQNGSAIHLAEREHFNAIYFKTRNKAAALEHLQQHFNIEPQQIAYCFDDVLDLPIAQACGARFLISRRASALFTDYVKSRQLCDYISGQPGGLHGVREVCELVLGLLEQFDDVIVKRGEFEPHYRDYLQQRNSGKLQQFVYDEARNKITAAL